jgi:nicotinamidase-related amidase
MHKISIPEHIVARERRMRDGKEQIFETLDMSKVAHVIVDLQVGFVTEGAPVEVPVTREIFGEVNSISRAGRAAGGLNVFLRYTTTAWQLAPELEVAAGDLIVDKTRFSALIPGMRYGRAVEGVRHRHPHHHGYADQLLLREHGARRAAGGIQHHLRHGWHGHIE